MTGNSADTDFNNQQNFVDWFRNSAPYIHTHRNRTFVISFGGEALQDGFFASLVHDFALLNSLGIRLVLVHGIRPQIDVRLKDKKVPSQFNQQLRITDDIALQCAKEAAGFVRVEIESLLSMGLANSPMSGAQISVISGNFVTAKPIGVLNGIDHCHTGKVRKIDGTGIHAQLAQNNIVLISPIGYSPSGEAFNLSSEQVAMHAAITLQAEKLIFLNESSCNIAQMTLAEAEQFIQQKHSHDLQLNNSLNAAITACRSGIERTHIINRKRDGALLLELFSHDGIGTLISATKFESLRRATIDDIGGILELIKPLEKQGKLVKRSREKLEMDINDYYVIDIDGLIIGCAALHNMQEQHYGLISCVAVHPSYQRAQRGDHLLQHLCLLAKKDKLQTLYVLSTQTMHWFIERGFSACSIDALPDRLKMLYNKQRNSKAFSLRVT